MSLEKALEAASFIQREIQEAPSMGLILGSGLGELANRVEGARSFSYASIPHFPTSTVQGHTGRLLVGRLAGVPVAVLQGRFHTYEGYSAREVAFPVRVLHLLGVKRLIVTNAAGGIDPSFRPGDLMLITNHINWQLPNPLVGPHEPRWGERFPDMTQAYSPRLQEVARKAAERLGISLRQGVYLATSGPSYETPAEIRAFRLLGASAVGMSTVPEVIAARQVDMEVLGLSCITNLAAGILNQPLTHEEVLRTSQRAEGEICRLLHAIVEELAKR